MILSSQGAFQAPLSPSSTAAEPELLGAYSLYLCKAQVTNHRNTKTFFSLFLPLIPILSQSLVYLVAKNLISVDFRFSQLIQDASRPKTLDALDCSSSLTAHTQHIRKYSPNLCPSQHFHIPHPHWVMYCNLPPGQWSPPCPHPSTSTLAPRVYSHPVASPIFENVPQPNHPPARNPPLPANSLKSQAKPFAEFPRSPPPPHLADLATFPSSHFAPGNWFLRVFWILQAFSHPQLFFTMLTLSRQLCSNVTLSDPPISKAWITI